MAYDKDSDSDDVSSKDERVTEVRKRWKTVLDGWADWRNEARADFAFRDGDQWSQEDVNYLNQQRRPALTFNRIQTMVESVCGIEVNNRLGTKYFAREVGDARLNELFTAAAKWVREGCMAPDEESEAFRDAVTCGVGVTETCTTYEENPDGDIVILRRDPLYTFPDRAATRMGFTDARYVFHAEWMDREEIEARWPESEVIWTDESLPEGNTPHNNDRSFFYEQNDVGEQESLNDKALVLHYQCAMLEPVFRFEDPSTRRVVEMDKEKFGIFRKAAEKEGFEFVRPSKKDQGQPNQIAFIERKKKVYYRGFYIGDTELEWERSPIQEGFTFKFITGRRDRNKRCFYGIVRSLRDPQQWANKWLSQILQIVNTNSKGGAFVEENALLDQKKAEEQWGSNDAPLIMLTEGGLNKVRERAPSAYPQGLDRLMTFAFESMPFVSGLNLEALGLANREQANALEETRRKAAVAILAPLFGSLSLYRKQQGHLLLFFIREYLTDGRLIRIEGKQDTTAYVPLTRDSGSIRYDVVVGETPDSPDFKQRVWQDLQPLLSVLLKTGKQIPAEVLNYSSLPTDVSQILQKAMAPQGNPEQLQQKMQQMQQQMQQMQQEIQKREQMIQQMKADQTVELQKAQMRYQENKEKVEGGVREAMINADMQQYIKQMEASNEAQADYMKEQMKIMADERKELRKLKSDFQKIAADLEGKKYAADKAAESKITTARYQVMSRKDEK